MKERTGLAIIWIGLLVIVSIAAVRSSRNQTDSKPVRSQNQQSAYAKEAPILLEEKTPAEDVACVLSDIKIKTFRASFKNECRNSECVFLRGAAVLMNECAKSIGVEIKIIGYDDQGVALAARDLWPASTTNIPPGEYVFSVDYWLDFDPAIKRLSIQPTKIHDWRQ